MEYPLDHKLKELRILSCFNFTGQTLLLSMAFTKPQLVGEVTSLSLINTSGTVMESFSVTKGQGIHGGSFYVHFTPSAQKFRFQLAGKTTKGKSLRRIKPTEIKIETVEIGFDYRLANNYTTIFPGITRKIPLKIRNIGTTRNFLLKATDDLGFVQSPVPSSCIVVENETVEFTLEVRAPSIGSSGKTSTVAVHATNNDQLSNYMVFYLGVAPKVNAKYAPTLLQQ